MRQYTLLDRKLRTELLFSDRGDVEHELTRQFVANSAELLPGCPYLVAWEWDVVEGRSQDGIGDLVFFDGIDAYAVVEVKAVVGASGTGNTARVSRRLRRRHVEVQALDYAEAWRARVAPAVVTAYSFADESGLVFMERARALNAVEEHVH